MNGAPEPTVPRAGAAKGRRIPIVLVLVALLATAIAAGDRTQKADAGGTAPRVKLAASMPTQGARSSAWYCAGGPIAAGKNRDRVTISNLGPRSVRVAIDVLLAGRATSERVLTIAKRSSRTFAVSRLSPVPLAAVVVQAFGPGIVVQEGFAADGDVALVACATRASARWYFAAGSTGTGTQQWISLLNPFGVDAVVDIETYTENGLRAPSSLQGLVVAHGSRRSVRVDHSVAQQRIVSVAVQARRGSRVVASQALLRPRSDDRVNASLSLGALAPSRTWMFADNRSRAGSVQQVVLANPDDADASVRVSVATDVARIIAPRNVRVPATGAVAVDLAGVVPPGLAYTLVVRSTVPIVAETRDFYLDDFAGLVTEVGASATARRWVFGGGPYTATGIGGADPRVPAGFDASVIMSVDASDQEITDARQALQRDSLTRRVRVVNRTAALAAFRKAARNNPALLETATLDTMSVSFDVQLENPATMTAMSRKYARYAGVEQVVTVDSQPPAAADEVVVFNPGARAVSVTLVPVASSTVVGIDSELFEYEMPPMVTVVPALMIVVGSSP